MPVDKARSRKFSVTIGEWDYRQLKVWAWLHNKPLAQYAAQILSARTEANFKLIEEMLAEEARFQGKTPDEVEAEILNLPEEEEK